ncbi:hypothetical protein BHAOGJBA_1216 [Methylobacterium hispanicum]|uniref:Uncharacterized protein n=1 Tax=Methylobacterium hispanicum TaxID=270350 RepID=A0AAV4ZH09_9HYPH|nr:hypothetical protein [Methylobacterium hispanicum]GJD87711.1 hypothetical protein BHAOGJBA_1216 [Methylobacterium hispanicum]
MPKNSLVNLAAVVLATSLLGSPSFAADLPDPAGVSVPWDAAARAARFERLRQSLHGNRISNRLSFDKRGDWGTAEVEVEGSGITVDAVSVGDHADTTLEARGRNLDIKQYQFGSSQSHSVYTGADSRIFKHVPLCDTGLPQRTHAVGSLVVEIPSCR